jgi:hypothetical protein
MFLGLLMAGMGLGAVAAGAWVFAGGSLLIGLVLYSLVGTAFVLGTALVSFHLSERRAAAEPDEPEVRYAAE